MSTENLFYEALNPTLRKGVMYRFFSLCGEKFNVKWLFKYGFWRVIYFGIIVKFGIITVNKEPVNGIYISYGTANPLQDLLDKGYRVRLIGWVFNEPILEYSQNEAKTVSVTGCFNACYTLL